MSIINKPNSIQKNEQAQISLSKSNLQAIASVEADSYFSDTNNWKEVILYYKSSEGNQKQILKFDASLQSPTATFFISNKARNEFQIQKIVIVDFDNDSFQIDRSELNTENFDISTSSIRTENVIFIDPINVDTYSISGNNISKESGPTNNGGVYHSSIRSQQSFIGDGYVEWTNNDHNFLHYMVSLSKDPRGNGYPNQEYAINRFLGGYEIYVSGSFKGNFPSNAQNVKIEKSGTSVKFYLDNNLIYTETIAADNINSYYLECSFYDVGSGITNSKINGNL